MTKQGLRNSTGSRLKTKLEYNTFQGYANFEIVFIPLDTTSQFWHVPDINHAHWTFTLVKKKSVTEIGRFHWSFIVFYNMVKDDI